MEILFYEITNLLLTGTNFTNVINYNYYGKLFGRDEVK